MRHSNMGKHLSKYFPQHEHTRCNASFGSTSHNPVAMYPCIISIMVTLRIILTSCDIARNNIPPWNRDSFPAVTQFEDLEAYYLRIRSQQAARSIEQPRMDVVRRICESIFDSPFFEMRQQDHWFVADCKVMQTVLLTYPSIFKHIYQRCYKFWHKSGDHGCHSGYHYENPYKARALFLQESTRAFSRFKSESVFVCLTKTRGTAAENIREYFVSIEYDVNDVAESNVPVYARFIFTRNVEKKMMVLAMAEECSLPLEEGLKYSTQVHKYEWFYYVNKHRFKNHRLPRQDSICRLHPAAKRRLCATVLSSPPFSDSKFFPTMDHVRTGCERITVSFRDGRREREARKESNRLVYQDWMIACLASPIDQADQLRTYFVSRGLRSNHVFVHELVGGRVFVKSYMVNVGAVLESDVLEE